MRHLSWFDDLVKDLHYAARMLRRSRGFTATAVVALALGVGATTAVFSVVNAVLLRPLPYPHSNRIVLLMLRFPGGQEARLDIPEFMAMREATKTLSNFSLYSSNGSGINLTGGDRPTQLKGIHVSANYFRLFGAPLALGRTFTAVEDRPGGPHVAVISYSLWRARFGGDLHVIGKVIELAEAPYVVTGVLGPTFQPSPPADIWLPLQANPDSTDETSYLRGAAILKPGASLGQADAELRGLATGFKRKFARFASLMGAKTTFTVRPLQDVEVASVGTLLRVLLAAVTFVLLIACANVANLLLARATLRKRELTIRAAVGAGRRRIIRQLLTESVLLSLAGGAVGLVIGYVGVRVLLAVNPSDIPRIAEDGSGVSLDWRVLVFTVVVAVGTGILFGLIPALGASRSDLNVTLRESGARSGTGLQQNKSRSILVIVEVALAFVLLVGATLMIRTFVEIERVDPGFNPHNILTMQMSLAGGRFKKTAAVALMERDAQRRVGAIPGVANVAATCCLPLQGPYGIPFNIIGRSPTGESPYTGIVGWAIVSPQFFKVFQIPLIRGRLSTDLDIAGNAQVAVINEAMAKKYWKEGDPVGQKILLGKGVGPQWNEPAREVVGIVGDIRDAGLNHDPPAIIYTPAGQLNDGITALIADISPIYWAIQTRVPPFSLSLQIQQQLRVATGGLPVADIRSMDQVVVKSTSRAEFNMILFTIFAGVALLLAGIGIYGLIAYSVEQQTRVIGIRMALGASPQGVRNMVVRQGMKLALIGEGIGVAAALALTRLLVSMLYGVKAWDPIVFISVAILLSLIALAAAYIPARRVARVDPAVALRHE